MQAFRGISSVRNRILRAPYIYPNVPLVSRFSSLIGPDCVVSGSTPDIELPKHGIYKTVSEEFSKFGSRTAIVNGLTGREYSFNELDENICKFSSSLLRMGFGRGDVMCIVSPNSTEYPVAFLGVLRSGGVVSTCNPAFTSNELAFQFQNSNAKMVTTVPECLSTVQEAAAQSKVEKIIVIDTDDPQHSSGFLISYQSMVKESGSTLDAIHTDLCDVAVLPYSSGTTGFPKGVMLTNRSVTSNLLQLIHPEFFDLKKNNPSSCLMGVLPFFHIYGMVVVLLSSLFSGSKLISLPKFEPEIFVGTIDRYKVSILHVVPPLVLFLAKHPIVENYDLSSVDEIMTGAAPLGGEVVEAAMDRSKCKLIRQGYGLTETSPVTHMMPRSLGTKYPSSIGECLRSCITKVINPETNEALPPNTEGELWINGPHIMKGYLNNPEATRNCIMEGGWFKTGDVGM